MRGQALQFFPIITAALSNVRAHRLAALIGLTNAKAHVQQVAMGPFSWLGLLLHCLISSGKGNTPRHVHYSCNSVSSKTHNSRLSECIYAEDQNLNERRLLMLFFRWCKLVWASLSINLAEKRSPLKQLVDLCMQKKSFSVHFVRFTHFPVEVL